MRHLVTAALAALLLISIHDTVSAKDEKPTNLVLIMTDNHGAWTLGCYGNQDIRTPNIDRLARQGLRFTRAFSSNAVCSPTRATYLTGLLPSQHGVHCFLRAGEAQIGDDAWCMIREFRTLSEILAENGYTCGLSGKWHLGKNLQPQEGFTSWITMPHGGTREFYDAEVIENGEIRVEPKYLTDLWTERGVKFLEENRDRPFFLFLSYNGPYGLGRLLLNEARNRHAKYYADKDLPSFPRGEMHPWQYNNKEYFGNPVSMRRVAAEVSGVDDGVGEVMAALERLGLEENTLVIFTADQASAGGQHGLWGMGDHTRPLHAFDGTMHIPMIVRQPGVVPSASTTDIMTSNYDLMPTVLDYLGLADKMPNEPKSPGRSYAATLRGESQPWENVVFYEFENVRAIRTGEWKYIERFPDGPNELYDLTADPGEQFNLFGQSKQAEVQAKLKKRLHAFFNRYADPKYDLWHGGKAKTLLLSEPGKHGFGEG
jgi:arylsulfatase A-like enzyme